MLQAAVQGGHELEKRVADPVLWMSEAQDTIIETEDEVPVWIGISSSKKVYSERVVQNRRSFEEARKKRRKQQELPAPESSPAPAHQPADVNKAETLEEDQFGLFQLRGEEKADETRKRVTWVNRPCINNYFKEDIEPAGFLLPEVLVVAGVHCRLASISSDGKWMRDEVFDYQGKQFEHKQGTPVGNALAAWRILRGKRPDLFEQVHVYAQPAAFRDEVFKHVIYLLNYQYFVVMKS